MKNIRTTLVRVVLLLALASGCQGEGEQRSGGNRAFQLASAERTNITFANNLSERPTPHRTELLYEYFINGGGVAVGDVNGDGREDLYFTGNMRFNKLYLNRGNFSFEDVTSKAGVQGRKNTWNTGVTMVDVNGDGRLDLYVCYSGELPLDRRVDELYINQGTGPNGIPQFEERAEAYGLAQPHSSNQAYFFDSDRDGDLDLFLQTHNVKTLPRGNRMSLQKRLSEVDSVNGNRFYENQGGTFVDVTGDVGIQSSPLTYGLGAVVSDFNKDGWPDVYVGNDYSPPDHFYINDGDGTFTDRLKSRMGHTSRASMGIDVSDVNNDGFTDVVVLDMLPPDNRRQKLLFVPTGRKYFEENVRSGFHYQYTMNTLQLNNGNGTYSEVGQLAGISSTDWSWTPLIADFDNDGWKDLFVTNGLLHDITNRDFLAFKRQYTRERNYDLSPKDISYLMERMPSTDLENYVFRNRGGGQFEDVSREWGLDDDFNSNGAAYADLDNDGDLDIVTNNINENASIYINSSERAEGRNYLKVRLVGSGGNVQGLGAKVYIHNGGTKQYAEQYPTRGYLSSVSPRLHFGLGTRETVDSLHVVWPDQSQQVLTEIQANQTLTLRQEEAGEQRSSQESQVPVFEKVEAPFAFEHRMQGNVDDFRRQPLLVTPKSFAGPALARSDVNGDGLADLFVGGGNGQASMLYLQQADGQFVPHPQSAFEEDERRNDVDAEFVDINADGHPDLYVASGGYGGFSSTDAALQDRLYVNDGSGNFSRQSDALPQMRTSTGTVAAADVNGDGHRDLFVGGRVVPGRYPEPPRSYVLMNDGQGRFEDRTDKWAPELKRIGMVTDAVWHDLNGRGGEELIVVGEWFPIRVFETDETSLVDKTNTYFNAEYSGLWNTVTVGDLNGDDRPDLVAGNLGLNTQVRASKDHPAQIHYADYDNNGSVDPIFSYYVGDARYPQVSLDRLRDQVPDIGFRFSSYEQYAEATLGDVLTKAEREASERLSAQILETSLFVMDEDGRFVKRDLPMEAQMSPVYDIRVLDYNGDKKSDLVFAGNMNESRVRFGKYDANYGVLLRGHEDGFEYVPQVASGFRIRGDARASVQVGDRLFFGVNRDSVSVYEMNRASYVVSR